MKNIRYANELLGVSVGETFSMLTQTEDGPRSSEPFMVNEIIFKNFSIRISCHSQTTKRKWTMFFPFAPADLRSDS
jgi:hypothetical protein